MESLENQVREALIQSRTDALCKSMQEQGFKDDIKSGDEILFGYLFKTCGAEPERINDELAKLNFGIEKIFSDPNKLQQKAYLQAQVEYMTMGQWKERVIELYDTLNENVYFDGETIFELQKEIKKSYRFFDFQDRIVMELTKIAEIEGVEKASTDEARFEVIRGIFPTKDEYVAHKIKMERTENVVFMLNYLAFNTQQGAMMSGENGQSLIRAIFDGLHLEEMKKLREQSEDRTPLGIEEIYGA